MSSLAASILIVAYRSGPHLGRCLAALAAQTCRDFEVILVDNGASDDAGDGAVDALPHHDWLTIDRAPSNLGFAGGNNRAAGRARGRFLITLNPDAFPEPGWLAALLATAERHPEAASVASVQLRDADPDRLDGLGDCYAPWGAAWRGGKGGLAVPVAESQVFGPCGAAALYRRDAFEAAGGFCERFFCYYEDVDLALRLRRAGWTSVLSPWAIVRHVGTGASPSDFVLFHATRNRIWAYFRGLPASLASVFLPVMLALALAGVAANIARPPGRTRLCALLDGFRALPGIAGDPPAAQDRHRSNVLPALTWSPLAYLRRAPDTRPLRDLGDRVPEPPEDGASIAAVIVSHRPDAGVADTIRAARAQCDRVVIVDNGSPPEALARLRALADGDPAVSVLENASNIGLAAAQNQGLVLARRDGADWVLLLDDDSVPDDGLVAALLAAWRRLPDRRRVAILAPRLTDAGNTLRPYLLAGRTGFGLRRASMAPGRVVRHAVFAIASGSLIRAGVVDAVGPMAAPFFIDYVDIEFCLRLRRAGFEIVGVGDGVLRHRLGEAYESSVLGRRRTINTHSAWRRRLIHRNRVRVWRRYGVGEPAWLAFDVAAALYDLWKAAVYEPDKREKVRAILTGFAEGWRR